MSRFALIAGSAVAAALAAPALAQSPFDDVAIETSDLGDGLYMLEGRGGNIGLSVGEDGVFMIDDQFAPLTDRIEAAIAEVAGAGDVRFIVNTHYHADHTGGNETLAGRGATVFAHENVRARLMEPQISTLSGETGEAAAPGAWPTVTFADAVTFHMNGETVRVIHAPHAHTDGDVIVHFVEADLFHMGDIFWNGLFPYIDLNAGGSIDGYIRTLDAVLEMSGEDTRFIAGHGALGDREDVAALRDMLGVARQRISEHVEAGDTLEATIEAAPLADYAAWGGFFIDEPTFVRLVYDDVIAAD